MCCNLNRNWFHSHNMWLVLFGSIWLYKAVGPIGFVIVGAGLMLYSALQHRWSDIDRPKRKNDEFDDNDRDDGDFEKPKRRTVYVRTSDGEFIEVPADELEYV